MTTKRTRQRTETAQEYYERMREVAQRDGLIVVGTGHTKDGRRVYAVPSRTVAHLWHLVTVIHGGLQCDCTAAQYNRYCCHRAAARARIEAEASSTRTRVAEASLRGGSPRPRTDTRPFSIFAPERRGSVARVREEM